MYIPFWPKNEISLQEHDFSNFVYFLLRQKAYEERWIFGQPPRLPLPCPHGLWMTPNHWWETIRGHCNNWSKTMWNVTRLLIFKQVFPNLCFNHIITLFWLLKPSQFILFHSNQRVWFVGMHHSFLVLTAGVLFFIFCLVRFN